MRLLSKAKLVALAVIASAALMDEVHHPDSRTVVTGEIGVLARESVQGVSGLNFRMKMFNAKRKTTIEYENVDKAVFFNNDQENLKKGTPLQITLTDRDKSYSFLQLKFSAGLWVMEFPKSGMKMDFPKAVEFGAGTWDFEFRSVVVKDSQLSFQVNKLELAHRYGYNPQGRSVIVEDSQRRVFAIPEGEIESISIGAVIEGEIESKSIKERALLALGARARVLPNAGGCGYSVLA